MCPPPTSLEPCFVIVLGISVRGYVSLDDMFLLDMLDDVFLAMLNVYTYIA